MNKQLSTSELKIESVYVASDIVRAQRKKRSLRKKRAIGLIVGFALIGIAPYVVNLFSFPEAPARIQYLSISGAHATSYAPAGGTNPEVIAAQKRIAAAQAGSRQTIARFEAAQDAFLATLAAPDAGAALFADESENELARSMPPFIDPQFIPDAFATLIPFQPHIEGKFVMNKPLSTSEIEGSYSVVSANPAQTGDKRKKLRKLLLLGLAGTVLCAGAAVYGYETVFASRYVTTDNAYVSAETASVTPQVSGQVQNVNVSDTDWVQAGDILVVLDATDARLAVAQAQAALDQAERKVRGYFANDEGLSAQVAARQAERLRAAAQIAGAQADLERARIDFARREALSASGAVSGEELTKARNLLLQAQASLNSARASQAQTAASHAAALGTLKANSVLTANTTVDTNPEVASARTRLEQARVDLERTVIRAPVDGVVARRDVQVGQRVQAGTPLMSVVPIEHAYVDANFKEGQLAKVRDGQPVELESDLYGSNVVFHGTVTGLSGGTGSSFAIIPAQNATGNWIKVVQRVPVQIELDAAELQAHPLRVGLSMTAMIDTKN